MQSIEGNKKILSDAILSLKTEAIFNINIRIPKLKNYENWGSATNMDFKKIAEREAWKEYREILN